MNVRSATREGALFTAGLVLGAANTVRHNRQGYVDPRPFSPDDIDRTIEHAVEIVDLLTECGKLAWPGMRVLEIGPGSDLTTGAVMLEPRRGRALSRGGPLRQPLAGGRGALRPSEPDDRWERSVLRICSSRRPRSPAFPTSRGTFDASSATPVSSTSPTCRPCFAVCVISRHRGARWSTTSMVRPTCGGSATTTRSTSCATRTASTSGLLDFPGAPNRLRASDYQRLAREAGWPGEIVVARRAPDGYVARTRVARRFRRYDDLDVLTFTLVAASRGRGTERTKPVRRFQWIYGTHCRGNCADTAGCVGGLTARDRQSHLK